MAYTRRHSEWKNFPNTTTPIRAEDLDAFEGGLEAAASVADMALDTASTAASRAANAEAKATAAAAAVAAGAAPTKASLDAALGGDVAGLVPTVASKASSAYFNRRPAGGVVTTGDVVTLGSYASAPADVATGLVAGGAPLYENVVGGNIANIAPPTGGGTKLSNTVNAAPLTGQNGNWAFILAGYDNVLNGFASVLNGFHCAIGIDANHGTISGGSHHRIDPAAAYSTISGGTQNKATGSNASLGGGRNNTAAASSTIAGGSLGNATGQSATIGGGYSNTASGDYSTVAGGNTSTASANSATVSGGQANNATGQGATVPGGRDNNAAMAYSVASGRGAVTSILGERAHASTPFVSPGDAQESTVVLKRQSTDATVAPLTDAGGGSAPLMPPLSTNAFTVTIVARRTDVEGDHAAWKVQGCLARHAVGSTLVGTPTVTSMGATAGAAAWVVAVTYSSGRLILNTTGEAGKTIRWVGRLELTQVAVS